MGAKASSPVTWGCYAATWSLVAYRAGLSAALRAALLGVLPFAILLKCFPKAFTDLTGFMPKAAVDEAKRSVRSQEREAFRRLKAKQGGESTEWLNVLLERMWPHIAEFGEKTILGFEATIQSKVPVPGGIRFKKCSLGREPIRFGPVRHRLIPSYYGDKYMEEGGVELQIGVTYHSDVEILLATKVASVGIAALEITGTLSVLLAPLLSSAPFFGGIQVLFTNPPKVDVDFRGIGNVADMPGIYTTVRRLIDDAIARAMVSPNRIAHQIGADPQVDLARLRNPPPEGVLSIRVIKAASLEGKDVAIVSNKTSDPYVQVKVGGEFWKTPTIMKTCNPVWEKDNVHEFVVFSSEQGVQIDVFDWDRIGADDPLGSINNYTVRDFIALSGKGPQPWRLEARTDRDDPPPDDARLFLEVAWLWLVHPLKGKELPGPCKYVLAFKIDDCYGLPSEGLGDNFRVRCTVKFAGISKETKPGWSKWSSRVTPKTLDNIRKLHKSGCSSSVIAEVAEIDENLIDEFLRHCAVSANNEEWLQKLSDASHARERCCNPQFEEVLLMKLPSRQVTVEVELLSHPVGKRKGDDGDVVGSFEVHLGEAEVVDGPFTLRAPLDAHPSVAAALGDGQVSLRGTFTLWRLELRQGLSADLRRTPWESTFMHARVVAGARHVGPLFRGMLPPSPYESLEDLPAMGDRSRASSEMGPMLSTGSMTPVRSQGRKRDRVRGSISRMLGRPPSEQAAPDSPSSTTPPAQPSGTRSTSSSSLSAVFQTRGSAGKVREAVQLMHRARGKDVLFGLGMLKGEREWAQAQALFRENAPGGDAGGRDPLTAALEEQLGTDEDRALAAGMLRANGIGLGTWPPPLPLAASSWTSSISSVKSAVAR